MTTRVFYFFIGLLAGVVSIGSAGETGEQSVKILCLGDSITQAANLHYSYRYYLWKKMVDRNLSVDFIGSMTTFYPDRDVTHSMLYKGERFDADHEGHWGWCADQILGTNRDLPESTGKGNLGDWLTKYTPDIVLLHLGHNDVGLGESPEETAAELKKIIVLLHRDNPDVSVLLAKVIPTDTPEWNDRLNKLNSAIQRMADDIKRLHLNVSIIDLAKGFNVEQDTFDGIHPNEIGAEKMAEKWLDGILQTGRVPHPRTIEIPSTVKIK